MLYKILYQMPIRSKSRGPNITLGMKLVVVFVLINDSTLCSSPVAICAAVVTVPISLIAKNVLSAKHKLSELSMFSSLR
jgi:hypothetical protein